MINLSKITKPNWWEDMEFFTKEDVKARGIHYINGRKTISFKANVDLSLYLLEEIDPLKFANWLSDVLILNKIKPASINVRNISYDVDQETIPFRSIIGAERPRFSPDEYGFVPTTYNRDILYQTGKSYYVTFEIIHSYEDDDPDRYSGPKTTLYCQTDIADGINLYGDYRKEFQEVYSLGLTACINVAINLKNGD